MATTKIWAVKGGLSDSVEYVKDPMKCTFEYITADGKALKRELVSGINCDVDAALYEMREVKKQFNKTGGIIAHHAEQSFAPGEITPEKAHEIGIAFAREVWGDRFQVVVSTHLDKAHIHNHFLINSVSYVDGKKYNGCKATYQKIREVSDRYCLEEGLSVVENSKDKTVSRAEYQAKRKGKPTYRSMVMEDIDYAITKSSSMDEFYEVLRGMGYEIKFGKYVAVRMEGKERFLRLNSLKDDAYLPDGIRRRIAENYSKNFGVIKKGRRKSVSCHKTGHKLSGYKALYVRYLFVLGKIPQKRYKEKSYHTRRELRHLEHISSQVKLIYLNKIETADDLTKHMEKLNNRYDEIYSRREINRKKIRRAISEDMKESIRNDISFATHELKILRRDISTCKSIEEKVMYRENKIRRREMEVKNEYGSRNRGNDR